MKDLLEEWEKVKSYPHFNCKKRQVPQTSCYILRHEQNVNKNSNNKNNATKGNDSSASEENWKKLYLEKSRFIKNIAVFKY